MPLRKSQNYVSDDSVCKAPFTRAFLCAISLSVEAKLCKNNALLKLRLHGRFCAQIIRVLKPNCARIMLCLSSVYTGVFVRDFFEC